MRATGLGSLLSLLGVQGALAEEIKSAVLITGIPQNKVRAQRARGLVQDALSRHAHIRLLDDAQEQFYFASIPPPDPAEDLIQAQGALKAAEERFREFDIDGAEVRLKEASRRLKPHRGLQVSVRLDRRQLQLAVAIAHVQRKETALARALAQYAARFSDTDIDRGLWPPELVQRFKELTGEFSTVLKVVSSPPGEAFVDGRPVGVTPVELKDLAAGKHRVEVRAPGRWPAQPWVETGNRTPTEISVTLPPSVSQALETSPSPRTQPLSQDLQERLLEVAREVPLTDIYIVHPHADNRMTLTKLTEGSPSSARRVEVAMTPEGANHAVAQLLTLDTVNISPWPWIGAGTGVALASAGIALRLLAVSTQDELLAKQGALTQTEAYALRDEVNQQALAGTVLITVGAVAFTAAAGWLGYEWFAETP